MKKFIIYILICCCVVNLLLYFLIIKPEKDILNQNSMKFIEKIKALDDGQVVLLNELTDFEWDTVYDLAGFYKDYEYEKYVGKQPFVDFVHIEDVIGMSNLLFVKDEKAVCYITGYYTGIDILIKLNSFRKIDSNCRMGEYEDDIIFNVKKEGVETWPHYELSELIQKTK